MAQLTKLTLVGLVLVFVFNVGKADSSIVDDKKQEINELQSKIDHYQNLADKKAEEINSLESQVASLEDRIIATENQIKITQLKIDKAQLEIDKTNEKIKEKNKELSYQKSVLDEALRTIYEEGNAGFLESFLTAETLTDLMDRTEYLDTVSNKIETTMAKIEKIKSELLTYRKEQENKKTEKKALLAELQSTKSSLNSQRIVKNNLISETQGEQALYKKNLSELSKQQLAITRWLGWYLNRGGDPGYSGWDGKCQNNCYSSYACDPQCVQYVSWRVGVSGWGDAHMWDDSARANGYLVDHSPRVGDVIVWERGPGMPYGHVAYVESVSGSSITVSQSNWGCNCCYSRMTIYNPSAYEYIHF